MTTASAPAARRTGALARGWHNFRRWRRGRPFWGGLLTLLAGIEIFFSGNLNLGELQLRVGIEGFQYYAISATLVLCGLLTWITPAQRIFYGVLAALVAVYSLIGVNLGGFFIGMFLGIIGGSLTAAWVPVAPVEPARATQEPDEAGPDELAEPEPPATMDELLTGPLTDQLPPPTTAPIPVHHPVQANDPRWGTGPPGGAEPRRSPPLLSITMIPVTLMVASLAVFPAPRAAHAAPCPPVATQPKPPVARPPVPPATSLAPVPTPSPSAADPAPATDENGNPISDFFEGVGDFLGGLLGGGQQQAEPTPTPTPAESTPAPDPTPTGGGGGAPPAPPTKPAPTPCKTTAPAPAPKPKQLTAAADQPPVAARAGRMTGTRVSMSGLSFDGVVSLPTVDPDTSVRVLQFSMQSSTTNDFRLVTIDPAGRNVTLTSSALTVQGSGSTRVLFYTSRFTGRVFGTIELTFTPDSPPPLVLPEMFFTNPDIELVFVDCSKLFAPDLRVTTP